MVMLSGEDSIVPAHSATRLPTVKEHPLQVRRYLTGWIQRRGGDNFRSLHDVSLLRFFSKSIALACFSKLWNAFAWKAAVVPQHGPR